MRQHWAFTIGVRDQPPPVDWLAAWAHHVSETWFPATKRPAAVRPGDRAVIYGSRGRGFIAAVEVVSAEPEPNLSEAGRERWPWKLRYRLLVSKAADGHVAAPEAAGIHSARIRRGPHTRLTEDEYHRAVAALVNAAADTAA